MALSRERRTNLEAGIEVSVHEGHRFAVWLANFEPVLKQVGDLGAGLCIPDRCGALRSPVLFPAPVALALVKNWQVNHQRRS